MPDVIHRAIEEQKFGDVLLDETEISVAGEVVDVRDAAGDKVINADNLVPALEQQVGEMRTKETGGTGDDGDGLLLFHQMGLFKCERWRGISYLKR